MTAETEVLREAWRKRHRGQNLTDEEREAVNRRQRAKVKHAIYFPDEHTRDALRHQSRQDGYTNFSAWLLDRVDEGVAAAGLDAAYVARLEQDLAKTRRQYDQLNELYIETASKSLQMQDENQKLSRQLARILRHVIPDDFEDP